MRRYWSLLLVVSLVWVMLAPVPAEADTPRRDIFFGSDRGSDVWDLEIYAMRADGTDIVQLTDDPDSWSNAPDLSPDGRFVVFHRCPFPLGSPCDIWIMNVDGSSQINLTNTPDAFNPRWSPDGRQILFAGLTSSGPPDLFVMDADGSNVTNITNTPTIAENLADWSPSGKEIVYEANFDVIRHDLTTGMKTNLSQSPTSLDTAPVWSPDGRKIAFTSNRGPDFFNFDIYVVDADGSNVVRLTESPLPDYVPHWSRSGKQIYFMSDRDALTDCPAPFLGFCTQLYVMDADGSNQMSVLVEDAAIHRFIIR